MKRLDELFDVRNGLASNQVEISSEQDDAYSLMYVCPSKTQEGAIAGWLNPDLVPEEHIYPAGTLHVSGDGAGSHTYSYVSLTSFTPTHHVRVLLPKSPMSERELRFYAYMITANRPKFNYGRAPRGERLAKIMLLEPNELPAWLDEVDLAAIERAVGEFARIGESGPLPETKWEHVKITDLFELTKGKGPTLADALGNTGETPYVTATDKNNGVAAWVSDSPCHEGGSFTVAVTGSVGEVFFQQHDFCASNNVAVLVPKFNLSLPVALFITTVLRHEGKTLFSYSRPWSINRIIKSSIWIPVTNSGSLDLNYIENLMGQSKFSV